MKVKRRRDGRKPFAGVLTGRPPPIREEAGGKGACVNPTCLTADVLPPHRWMDHLPGGPCELEGAFGLGLLELLSNLLSPSADLRDPALDLLHTPEHLTVLFVR
jgi:hypothetical protein